MSKKIVIIFVLAAFGCTNNKKEHIDAVHYPRAVHNLCTNMWAIQTSGPYGLSYYFGVCADFGIEYKTENCPFASMGNEYKYADSIIAMNIYNA